MRRGCSFAAAAAALLAAAVAGGCALVAGLGDYTSPAPPDGPVEAGGDDGPGISCGLGTKACGTQCVGNDQARYGCSASDCKSCAAGVNGSVACSDGGCALSCDMGFADCDTDAANGCEVEVANDPAHCGSCNVSCDGGACYQNGCVTTCPAGLIDCSGSC